MMDFLEELKRKLLENQGISLGRQAVHQAGPLGGMYQIDRLRREGLPADVSQEEAAMADRFAEGRAMRERYGNILGPAAATIGSVGYEGVAKPVINALPQSLSQILPESFQPDATTSPAGGQEALLRALAMIYGSMNQ